MQNENQQLEIMETEQKLRRVIFIDRDGTLIEEPEDEQVDSIEKLRFLPGVISALHQIARKTDYLLVLVTNQDGLGTPSFPEDTFWPVHNLVIRTLEGEGIYFHSQHIDRSFPEEGLPTRKPGVGMLTEYIEGAYDLSQSYVIGDRETDAQLARALGAKSISLSPNMTWPKIAQIIIGGLRTSSVHRKTSETDIQIDLNLDGTGKADIDTGLGFFDHMLQQIAKHGLIDLCIHVKGDLYVDEHHTIEDTALCLGQAIGDALGDKCGIYRYGFSLPMDDNICRVSLDLGGRPWLQWDASFQREAIGQVPTEMFFHFFKSLSDAAKMNLAIYARGENEHHKIEAIFKAFSRALRMALVRDVEHMVLPSSKGVL